MGEGIPPCPSPTKGAPLVSPCLKAGVLRGAGDKLRVGGASPMKSDQCAIMKNIRIEHDLSSLVGTAFIASAFFAE